MATVITPYCPAATTTQHALAAATIHRDQHQIRSRLLNSLGFFPVEDPSSLQQQDHHHPQDTANNNGTSTDSRSKQAQDAAASASFAKLSIQAGSENHLQESLKYKRDEIVPKQDAQVSFVDVVSVVEIPSHRDYGTSVRQDLWNGVTQVAEIVQRNKIEFQAEGWDWHMVLEEEDFVQLSSGELMHPATYKKRQQRIAHEKRIKKKNQLKKERGYKSIALCLSFPTHNYNTPQKPTKARSTTRKGGARCSPQRLVRKNTPLVPIPNQ